MSSIKQGETAQISITLDETLEDELCVGMFKSESNMPVMLLSTADKSLSGSGTDFSIDLSSWQTKNMLGEYYLELMLKKADQSFVCISDRVTFNVDKSSIGKEMA